MAITFDLTSNAVVNAGETASFEVSNITGVPVSGCPIGKTFYEERDIIGYATQDVAVDIADTIEHYVRVSVSGDTLFQFRFMKSSSNTSIVLAVENGRFVIYHSAGYNQSDVYSELNTTSLRTYVIYVKRDRDTLGIYASIEEEITGIAYNFPLRYNSGDFNKTCFFLHSFSGSATIHEYFAVGDSLPNNCTGEVADATIEYYRNGVLDYTGNPWSFPADGSMDGDSIVARVSSGVDFTDSDPVTMSVLHYTSQPPSPQNLTEGDPLSLTWDIAGANPVGSVTNYTVSKNGSPVDSGSTTDTAISYSIPSVAVSDAGSYDLTITNGGRDPFLSDPVVVNVGSGIYDPFNTITKGAKSVNTYTFYGCSTEIALGMDRNVDSRGFVQWLDNGKEYDNYYSEYSLDTENGKALEEILTDDTINVATISTPFVNGFYPFSPLFATNQDYSVYFSDGWKGLGDLDVNGLHRKYTLTIVPAVQDIYSSYTLNGVVSQGCIVDNWQINGVPFPFSEWSQDLNNLSRVVTLGGNASEIVDTKREYGDVVKLNLNCGEEQARQILYFITHVMRGTVQTATFPDVYNIFGRRYEGLTSCKVKLHSNILKVTHDNYHEVTIELELQMVGV